ncbi:MAG: trypsin-like peptidase domain-containing protein [Deltaproteobacteria bacterium]|nr:trypsin-like peptidase domain-containing protein [Deltaproteobacteria bacterium]
MTQPAVVTVISKGPAGTAFATGFFVEDDLVMTNRSLLLNGANVTIMTGSGDRIRMDEVVAASATYDIAIIRLSKTGSARLLISDRGVHKGQTITVVGAPLRGVTTFSAGTILELQESGAIMTLSATVTQRNSGAPILDENGYVVGVATRESHGVRGNFAIPVDHMQDLIAEAALSAKDAKAGKRTSGPGTSGPGTSGPGTSGPGTSGHGSQNGGAPDEGTTSGAAHGSQPASLEDDLEFVFAIKRGASNTSDDERKAQAACKFNENHGEYLCDPVVLGSFYNHLEVQHKSAAKRAGETLLAKLVVDKNGCVSSLKVTLGHETQSSSAQWHAAVIVVNGEATAASSRGNIPPPGFRVPAGARFSATLGADAHECLLPNSPATSGEDLVLMLPIQMGDENRTARFVWRQVRKVEPLSVWHAMRFQKAPPEAGPPGEQPVAPSTDEPAYGFYGAGVGAGVPLGAGLLIGVGSTVVFLGNGDAGELPVVLGGVAGLALVAAVVGGATGALMGVFASRQAQEERAILWRDYHRAHEAWSKRSAAHKKWLAYKRSTRSLHDGAR